jgi:ribosomal protein L37AE/L43A
MDFNGGMHREHYILYYRERLGQSIPAVGDAVIHLKCPFCSKEGKLKLNLSTGFWVCPTCQRSGKCYSMETMLSGCSLKDAVAKVHEVVTRVIVEEREKAERELAEYSKSSASLDFSQSEHMYRDEFGLNALLVKHATLFDGQVTVEYHAGGGNGQWQQITKELPQLLYRLPELLCSPSIIIAESETAADDVQKAL